MAERVTGFTSQTAEETLAVEEPLEIQLGYGTAESRAVKSISVTMRTPGHDRELAAGFLLSEGLINQREQIIEIAPCLESDAPENTLNVFLPPAVEVNFESLTRHVFASSSCGVCGKASIEAVHQHFPPVESDLTVSAEILARLPARLRESQETFAQTGGLHAAAIFDARGELIVLREDVGRHNAVDKVLGYALLEKKLPLDSHVLLVSGRASFEIMQKALAGMPEVEFANVTPLEEEARDHRVNVDTPDTAPTEDEPRAPKTKRAPDAAPATPPAKTTAATAAASPPAR